MHGGVWRSSRVGCGHSWHPGKQLKADRAKKMGLVDHVVDANALERTAMATAMDAINGTTKPRKRKVGSQP